MCRAKRAPTRLWEIGAYHVTEKASIQKLALRGVLEYLQVLCRIEIAADWFSVLREHLAPGVMTLVKSVRTVCGALLGPQDVNHANQVKNSMQKRS